MKKIFSFIYLFFAVSLNAQDTLKTTLNEVFVTATRTETPYYTLASSVSLITSEEIFRKQYNTVVDVLRTIPGLTIFQQGGLGKLSSLLMRGTNANHTLVLIDGAEVNDPSSPSNAFDFGNLNTYDIDRIEIVKGPQSTLYGSDAMGGVISIFTRKGEARPTYSLSGEVGANGFYKGSLDASGNYSGLSYLFSASRLFTNGISSANEKNGNSEKDGFEGNYITARIGYQFSPVLEIDLMYKFSNTKSDLDQSNKYGDDPNFTYNTEEQIFRSGLNFNLFDGKWRQSLSASFVKRTAGSHDLADQFRPGTSSESSNDASRFKIEWQNNFRLVESHLISFGIETETETASTSYFSESQWGPYESVFPEESISNYGLYLQDQFNLANSFFASVGIRYDSNEKFGSVVTYRIAPAYYINATGTKLKFTYGNGFKSPSLYYLFDPLFGNPDLKPEESRGFDLGIEQFLFNGRFNLCLTYFNLIIENLFGFDENFRTVNVAKASSKGLEFSASTLLEPFSFDASFTLNETKDEFELSPDYNKPLLRRPKQTGSLSITYSFVNDFSLTAQIRYVGKRDDKDFSALPAERVILPDYTIANLSAVIKLTQSVKLNARLENLFDRKYEEVLYYGTPGRSFYAGIRLDL